MKSAALGPPAALKVPHTSPAAAREQTSVASGSILGYFKH